jgi:hypothetical protein
MLVLLLLSASLLAAQDASLDCSNAATAQTQAVHGPAGVTALVRISTEDDHSKDSHECMADYKLVIQSAGAGAPVITDFLSSDGDWGRKLSVHLDGFSKDGKRVFGILAEGGSTPGTMVFEYHGSNQSVELLDMASALKQMAAARCGTSAVIAGTTESGAVVLQSSPTSQCRIRWLFDPAIKGFRRLAGDQAVQSLFK